MDSNLNKLQEEEIKRLDKIYEEICRNDKFNCILLEAPTYVKPEKGKEEYYNYLSGITGSGYRIKKELDFARAQADFHVLDSKALTDVYANELLPSADYAGLQPNVTHNLLISLLDFASRKKATNDLSVQIIKAVSDMLADKNFSADGYFDNIEIKAPGIKNEITNTLQTTQSQDLNTLYANFANSLHFKYKDNDLNPFVKDTVLSNNKQEDKLGFIKGLYSIALMPGDPITSGILLTLIKLLDIFSTNAITKQRYQNAYTYDEFAGEPNFFKGDEAEKIYGSIRMYVPFRDTQMFAAPESSAPTAIPDRINSIDNSSRVAGGNSFNFANGAFNFNITSTNPAQSAQEVRQVLLSVFDDVGMLMGYERKQL